MTDAMSIRVESQTAQPGNHIAVGTLGRVCVAASWVAQIIVAIILAQTLFFKFTYAPETQVIFADLGGRPAATVVGILELVCVALLLLPRMAALGALLSLLTISGAVVSHLTSLGIEIVNPETGIGDGGLLFGLAIVVAVGSFCKLTLKQIAGGVRHLCAERFVSAGPAIHYNGVVAAGGSLRQRLHLSRLFWVLNYEMSFRDSVAEVVG